jgi:hypothetical protein
MGGSLQNSPQIILSSLAFAGFVASVGFMYLSPHPEIISLPKKIHI